MQWSTNKVLSRWNFEELLDSFPPNENGILFDEGGGEDGVYCKFVTSRIFCHFSECGTKRFAIYRKLCSEFEKYDGGRR